MEPGTLYLPVYIHRFPILRLSFQPFRAFQVGNTQEGDKNPETPQNPRGVKGYEEIGCHWIGIGLALGIGLGRYTLQNFFWELSLFFLSCIVTVIYAFLLGELTALPIQRKCS